MRVVVRDAGGSYIEPQTADVPGMIRRHMKRALVIQTGSKAGQDVEAIYEANRVFWTNVFDCTSGGAIEYTVDKTRYTGTIKSVSLYSGDDDLSADFSFGCRFELDPVMHGIAQYRSQMGGGILEVHFTSPLSPCRALWFDLASLKAAWPAKDVEFSRLRP